MNKKDLNRWIVTKWIMGIMTFLIFIGAVLAYKEKDMVQFVGLASLFFVFAGAYFKFNFDTVPDDKGDNEDASST